MSDILNSWTNNASRWTELIREQGLNSRKYTNPAIVAQLDGLPPSQVCDLGCGEGWLVRTLSQKGHRVTGIDGTAGLIEAAQQIDESTYTTLSYDDIISGAQLPGAPFQRILLNFCLYQDVETNELLKALHPHLTNEGRIIIQTIHPFYLLQQDKPYQNQWVPNAWAGLPGDFSDPHPWFCRTLEGWYTCFEKSGWNCIKLVEVQAPEVSFPLSIIFHLAAHE